MTLPQTHDIILSQGKSFKYWFAVQYPDGEIADLAAEGYSVARMAIVPDYGAAPVLSISTASGGIHLERMYDADVSDPDRRQWSGYIWISAAATALLEPWGRGPWELEIANSAGDVVQVLTGTAVLEQEATV